MGRGSTNGSVDENAKTTNIFFANSISKLHRKIPGIANTRKSIIIISIKITLNRNI